MATANDLSFFSVTEVLGVLAKAASSAALYDAQRSPKKSSTLAISRFCAFSNASSMRDCKSVRTRSTSSCFMLPSATSRSVYSLNGLSCLAMALYNLGWVNIGSSPSLWPYLRYPSKSM